MNYNVSTNKKTKDIVKKFEKKLNISHSKLMLISICFYLRLLKKTEKQRNLLLKILEQDIPAGDQLLSIYINNVVTDYLSGSEVGIYMSKDILPKMFFYFIENYSEKILENKTPKKTKSIQIDTRFFSAKDDTVKNIKYLLRVALAFNAADIHLNKYGDRPSINNKITGTIKERKFKETYTFQGGEWQIYTALDPRLEVLNLRQYLPALVNHYFGNIL